MIKSVSGQLCEHLGESAKVSLINYRTIPYPKLGLKRPRSAHA